MAAVAVNDMIVVTETYAKSLDLFTTTGELEHYLLIKPVVY